MASSARALSPPRAAAIAGVIFSLLLSITVVISRLAVPPVQTDTGEWLTDPVRRNAARFAIQLAPFSGIAFLWFLGVIRNRLGALEDQFFATVFFGSGLLFVANLFVSAAFAGALLEGAAHSENGLLHSDTYQLIRQIIGASMNIFAVKMAGVFMVSTSTIVTRTGILPRWVAYSGFVCAAVLLLSVTNWPWILLIFPFWITVLSIRILLMEFRPMRPARTDATMNAAAAAQQKHSHSGSA
jgi:hypothetical protein